MEFELSADQTLLQDALRKFFAGEYGFEQRKRILASAQGYSPEVWSQLAAQGVLAVGLPAEQGGYGGAAEISIVMEQIGRHLVLEPFLSSVVLGGGLIGGLGSMGQREALLPAIASGDVKVAVARLEESGVSARRCADGSYVLRGVATLVLDAPVATHLIVPAHEDGTNETSVFLLDASAKGIRRVSYRTHDGRSAADIHLDEVAELPGAILGERGDAPRIAALAESLAIPALCAEAVAIMDALIEATLGYLQSRSQFGQPIGRFQALQHRLADMFVQATQARSMSLLARERARDPDAAVRRRALSSAKAYVDKAARFVGQNAIQLHGGMGMTAELIVSHYFKRLTLIGAAFGDRAHHLGVVSDAILAETA